MVRPRHNGRAWIDQFLVNAEGRISGRNRGLSTSAMNASQA
jgi:hypothetical protein